jgi:hypothetical protein
VRVIGCALALICTATYALAQAIVPLPNAVGGTTVDLHPLWTTFQPILETVVGASVTAILGWGAVQFQRWTGHEIEKKHMEALDASLKTGLGQVLAKVNAADMTVDVKRQAIVSAVDWANRSTPDALKYFGLDDPANRAKLGELAEGKLGQMLAQINLPATTLSTTILGGK